jgi:hypothetical protein
MTSRPHDALFKSAFEVPADAAPLLRDLVPPAIRDAVAWDTLERAGASFVDRRLADRHGDLLFCARLRAGEPELVFFLVEHQSTPDRAMAQRMLSYQTRIWDRFRKERPRARLPPVLAVLISHAPGGWTAPRAFEELFDPAVMAIPGLALLVPRCSMLTLDLARQSNGELQGGSLPAFQKLALWLLRDARMPERLLDNFEAWCPVMIEAGQGRSGLDTLAVLIEYMFRVVDPVYWEKLRAKLCTLGIGAEETTMTIADMLHAQGRAKGRAEGRAKGRAEGIIEGRIATLRSLLLFKFQTLDAASEARLQAATPEAIERYLRRLLTADSLAAVFES